MYEEPVVDYTDVNLSMHEFFLAVMKNKEAYECVLSIIKDERDLKLLEVKCEEIILNKSGKRSIRLDAWSKDRHMRLFDIEMQNDEKADDIPRRSRYYQALMDTPLLKAGKYTRYRELPPTEIIFITQKDLFGEDLAEYVCSTYYLGETPIKVEDGVTKTFLNMQSMHGRPELVSLLQYMKHSDINNPNILVKDARLLRLHEIVTEVKQSEEWEEYNMSLADYYEKRAKVVCVDKLIFKLKIGLEEACKIVECPIEEYLQIKEGQKMNKV